MYSKMKRKVSVDVQQMTSNKANELKTRSLYTWWGSCKQDTLEDITTSAYIAHMIVTDHHAKNKQFPNEYLLK